jgi:hypothetical protein
MDIACAASLLLPAFVGWTYARARPSYPWTIPGVPGLHVGAPRANNCCTFVEALVIGAASRCTPGLQWGLARHGQMMITGTDLFSPVTALVEAGLATEADGPEPWSVVQLWRGDMKQGHTAIIVDYHPATDRVLLLESNLTALLDGVGWRGLGALPARVYPEAWPTSDRLPTWDDITRTSPHWRAARLRRST